MEEKILLVIEDDPLVMKVYDHIAADHGVKILKAGTFEEFLLLIKNLKKEVREKISAVFTDDQIPSSSEETETFPRAEEIIQICIEAGIDRKKIHIVSGTYGGKEGSIITGKGTSKMKTQIAEKITHEKAA